MTPTSQITYKCILVLRFVFRKKMAEKLESASAFSMRTSNDLETNASTMGGTIQSQENIDFDSMSIEEIKGFYHKEKK
jgi:hypothetical protein